MELTEKLNQLRKTTQSHQTGVQLSFMQSTLLDFLLITINLRDFESKLLGRFVDIRK